MRNYFRISSVPSTILFSTIWRDRGSNLLNTDLVDKKGMEYMKERITHEKPGHQKIIREPKKLEHGWDQS